MKIHYQLKGGATYTYALNDVEHPITFQEGILQFEDALGDWFVFAPGIWESFWVEGAADNH